MSNPDVVKIFVPMRLVLGLVSVVAGAALVALAILAGFGLRLGAVGAVVVVAGVAIAWSSKVEGCAACKVPFISNHTDFRGVDLPSVSNAVGAATVGDPRGLGALASLQHQAPTDRVTATLEVSYCPHCNAIGRVFTAERHFQADGSSTLQNMSPARDLNGTAVKALTDALAARNTALLATFYGGGRPG